MAASLSGPWTYQEITDYLLCQEYPIRLSCVGSDGFPRVVSLWYQFTEPCIYCVTHRNSKLAKLLEDNPKVGFEISPNAPPYFGLRGQGSADMQPLGDSPLLENLLQNYVGNTDSDFSRWLLARSSEELMIRIEPHRLYSWDYRKRMETTR